MKFFGRKEAAEAQYTIDDLIVLERYADAEAKIREELKLKPNDLNLHLKLADVYVGLRDVGKAIDSYGFVADKYAADGFHDRAIAILTKARKLNPMDDTLPARVERLELARRLERSRTQALEGFVQGLHAKEGAGTAVMEFQTIWRQLLKSRLVRELSGEQLKLLFQGVICTYPTPGQTVADRGSREEMLFIVTAGEINATIVDRAGTTIDVRNVGPGQVFGESTLFEHKPWPATYRSKSKATLLKLTPPGLQVCLTGNPDPRGFLEALRREQTDRDVSQLVLRIEGMG